MLLFIVISWWICTCGGIFFIFCLRWAISPISWYLTIFSISNLKQNDPHYSNFSNFAEISKKYHLKLPIISHHDPTYAVYPGIRWIGWNLALSQFCTFLRFDRWFRGLSFVGLCGHLHSHRFLNSADLSAVLLILMSNYAAPTNNQSSQSDTPTTSTSYTKYSTAKPVYW